MEKIEGRPLQLDDVKQNPAFVHKVVAALESLHEVSVLHNDLKEDHIQAKDGPSIRIFDFDLVSDKKQQPHEVATWVFSRLATICFHWQPSRAGN